MAKKKKTKKSKVAKVAKRVIRKAKKAVKTLVRKVTAKKKKAPARKAAAKAKPAAKKKVVARKAVAVKKKAASGEYGEGNYKASKRFRTREEAFIKTNKAKIPAMAKAAEAALDGPEGDELRAAEASTAARGDGMEG
jgi:histone H1/5